MADTVKTEGGEQKQDAVATAGGEEATEYKGKVNLVSQEGDKFEVDKKVAVMSELVKTMIEDENEDEDGELSMC